MCVSLYLRRRGSFEEMIVDAQHIELSGRGWMVSPGAQITYWIEFL